MKLPILFQFALASALVAPTAWLPAQVPPPEPVIVRQYRIADLLLADSAERPIDAADKLVSLLESAVHPDSWRDNGGEIGAIRAVGDTLLVTQSTGGQAAVRACLDALRGALLARNQHPDYGPLSAYAILHRPIHELRLKSAPLDHVIDLLRSSTRSNVEVDWKSFEACGVDHQYPVTMELWDTTLGESLDALSSTHSWFGYELQEGVVRIATPDVARVASLQAHDVRPLIEALVHRPGRAHPPGQGSASDPAAPTRQEVVDTIIRLIEDCISPDSWKDNGGNAFLREFGGVLIVTQTGNNHRQLATLLDSLLAAATSSTQPANPAPPPPADAARLQEKIDVLNLESASLEDAIDILAEKTRAKIVLNRDAFGASGVSLTPIDVQLRDVPLHTALAIVLELASRDVKLGYQCDDEGVIYVSTESQPVGQPVVRIYKIRDLIESFASGSRLPAPGSRRAIQQGNEQITAQDAVDRISKLIEDTCDTDTWKDNGGSVGALREMAGLLIVTANPQTHQKIEALLAKLRKDVMDPATGSRP